MNLMRLKNILIKNKFSKIGWVSRVYEPERMEDGEVVWHLRRKPPAKLTNILTIGIYEGHAFFIKDIT